VLSPRLPQFGLRTVGSSLTKYFIRRKKALDHVQLVIHLQVDKYTLHM